MATIGQELRVKWGNFARGYNSVRQTQDMTAEELSDVMNFRYVSTPYGVGLTNRPGLVQVTGTTAITTAAVKDFHKYVDSTGKVFYLAACNSKLYSSTLGTSTTFSSVGDLGSTRGRMVNFAGRCCVADGAAMKYFVSTGGTDAGTFGTCTGSPPSAGSGCMGASTRSGTCSTWPGKACCGKSAAPGQCPFAKGFAKPLQGVESGTGFLLGQRLRSKWAQYPRQGRLPGREIFEWRRHSMRRFLRWCKRPWRARPDPG